MLPKLPDKNEFPPEKPDPFSEPPAAVPDGEYAMLHIIGSYLTYMYCIMGGPRVFFWGRSCVDKMKKCKCYCGTSTAV